MDSLEIPKQRKLFTKRRNLQASNRYTNDVSSSIRLSSQNSRSSESIRIHTLKKNIGDGEKHSRLYTIQSNQIEQTGRGIKNQIDLLYYENKLKKLQLEVEAVHGRCISNLVVGPKEKESKIMRNEKRQKMKSASIRILSRVFTKNKVQKLEFSLNKIINHKDVMVYTFRQK